MTTPTESAVSPAARSRRAWAVTIVATATMAISYLDRQVLAAISPMVREELHLGEADLGAMHSAFSFAYLCGAPLAGRLLERVGIRNGLPIAVGLWTVVSAMHGAALGFVSLFALRIALGLAEAPSFPGSAAAVARAQPPEGRARALGIVYTGSSLGAMIAPIVAVPIATAWGWRAAFVLVAILGLSWLPLWRWVSSAPEVRPLLDVAPAGSAPPASLLSTLRKPAVLRAFVRVLASSPLFAFAFLWSSEMLVHYVHVPQASVGRYVWLVPVAMDVGAVAFGDLASRLGKRQGGRAPAWLAAIPLALCVGGLGALPLVRDPWLVMSALAIAVLGAAGLFALLTADMIHGVGPALAATAGGITASAQSIAYIVANAAYGRAIEAFDRDYGLVVWAIALWIVPGTVLWIATRDWGRSAEPGPA